MNRKIVLTTIFLIILLCMLNSLSRFRMAEAAGTIYVEPNGSIIPADSPISSWNNATYWLTSNISSPIVIMRDNIFFNGSGNEILGPGSGKGIDVTQRTNVNITDVGVTGFDYGIWLYESSNCSLTGNNVTGNNWEAITLYYSNNNVVSGNIASKDSEDSGIWVAHCSFNTIINNEVSSNHAQGLYVDDESHGNLFCGNNVHDNNYFPWSYGIYTAPYSYNNTFIANNIANNSVGIYIHLNENNTIYHNNFIANTVHAYVEGNNTNIWNNGNEGNYWDNYTGPDTDHNGIGDTPYTIDANNTDHYPLMGRFQNFTVPTSPTEFQPIQTISNSTISNVTLAIWLSSPYNGLQPGQPFIQFTIEGQNGTVGFCRLMIPKVILNGSSYTVMVDSQPINATLLPTSNSTQATLYFTYTHSTHQIVVTAPEFSSFLIPALFMTIILLAVLVHRKKHAQTSETPQKRALEGFHRSS